MADTSMVISSLMIDIKALQDYLDYRSEREHYAIDLMARMEYDEAMRVLREIDDVRLEDFK